jgi:hypothetical protein
VLNIEWISAALDSPASVICPRSSACPRTPRCDRHNHGSRAAEISDVRQEILDQM